MPPVVVDDHLLRDVLVGHRSADLDGLAPDGMATTGLWLFRLCSSLAQPRIAGRLSGPVASLPPELQVVFRRGLVALPEEILVLSLRDLAWPMAELQARHRVAGRGLSTLSVEALAAAAAVDGSIAVFARDVGPMLRAAAEADGIPFHAVP